MLQRYYYYFVKNNLTSIIFNKKSPTVTAGQKLNVNEKKMS